MAAEDAVADGMEGSAPEAGGLLGQEGVHALEHFAGGFVGEGEQEDVLRGDGVFQEVGDAICQRPGLAAAGSGDDEALAGRRGDGSELLRIQLGGEIDLDLRHLGRGASSLQCVCARHGATGTGKWVDDNWGSFPFFGFQILDFRFSAREGIGWGISWVVF